MTFIDFVMGWLNGIEPTLLIMDLIIAFIFFAMGILFTLFISKERVVLKMRFEFLAHEMAS